MIQCSSDSSLFTLQTRSTTYQMKVNQYGILLHTYYGPRTDGDMSCLVQYMDRGFSPCPDETGQDRTFSLDTVPQEYSVWGTGDYRHPAMEVELADGSSGADLRFESFQIQRGKYSLEGLPAFFGTEEQAETLVIQLLDRRIGLRVRLYYGVFEDCDLITRAVQVCNDGDSPVTLRRCASLCLDFLPDSLDLITFDGRHTFERFPCRTPLRPGLQTIGSVRGMSSHQHNPSVILARRDAGEDAGVCWGVTLLYSGNFEASAERCQYEDVRLTMGIHPRQFAWVLQPGETFTAPEAAMVCSSCGFGHMSRQFHRAIREHLLRDPLAGRRKPLLLNSWEAAYYSFSMDSLLEQAAVAAEQGVELFVLDDGWFGDRNSDSTSLGDWQVSFSKLPGGLAALHENLQRLGMDLGLWIEPEMVSEESELYRTHPDWVLQIPGRAPVRGRSQLVLDFTRPEVREYVFQSLKPAIEEGHVSYIKWDMNRGLADVFSAALPAGREGEVFHRYVLGVYDLLEKFRTQWPCILIEGCAGGGGRFDAGMLYYTPQIWCSDNSDAGDRLFIQTGTSYIFPPCTMGAHVSAVPNHQNGRITPLETRALTAMCGTFGYELDFRTLSPAEKTEIHRQKEDYIRFWDLNHEGDFYRLSDIFHLDGYIAWEQVSRDRTEALISLVTLPVHSAGPFRILRLKGLDPDRMYLVEETGARFSGSQLMNAGYPLLPGSKDWQSMRLHLVPADASAPQV